MPDDPFDPEAYVDAAAAAVGLEIDPEQRPGVVLNLRIMRGLAQQVVEFPLSDADEAAPVFVP